MQGIFGLTEVNTSTPFPVYPTGSPSLFRQPDVYYPLSDYPLEYGNVITEYKVLNRLVEDPATAPYIGAENVGVKNEHDIRILGQHLNGLGEHLYKFYQSSSSSLYVSRPDIPDAFVKPFILFNGLSIGAGLYFDSLYDEVFYKKFLDTLPYIFLIDNVSISAYFEVYYKGSYYVFSTWDLGFRVHIGYFSPFLYGQDNAGLIELVKHENANVNANIIKKGDLYHQYTLQDKFKSLIKSQFYNILYYKATIHFPIFVFLRYDKTLFGQVGNYFPYSYRGIGGNMNLVLRVDADILYFVYDNIYIENAILQRVRLSDTYILGSNPLSFYGWTESDKNQKMVSFSSKPTKEYHSHLSLLFKGVDIYKKELLLHGENNDAVTIRQFNHYTLDNQVYYLFHIGFDTETPVGVPAEGVYMEVHYTDFDNNQYSIILNPANVMDKINIEEFPITWGSVLSHIDYEEDIDLKNMKTVSLKVSIMNRIGNIT